MANGFDDEDPYAESGVEADVEAQPPQAPPPLETLIRAAAQTGGRTLDEQFKLLAQAKGARVAAPGAAGGPGVPAPGPTWAERTQQPDYQGASTDRKNEIRAAWIANEVKYAQRRYAKKKDQDLYMEGVVGAVPSIKPPARSATELLGDVLKSFQSGARGVTGSVGGALWPTELYEGDAADWSNLWNQAAAEDYAKRKQEDLSAKTKDEQLYYEEQQKRAEPGGLPAEVAAAAKAVKKYPMLGAMWMAGTAPSLLATAVPGVTVAKGGALALKAIGVAEQQAAKWAVRAGYAASMSSAAVQGAGQARNQVVQQLMEAPDSAWETDDEYVLLREALGGDKELAKRTIAETRSILPGVIGAVIAGVSGRVGLEKVLIGGAGKGIRSRLASFAAEEAGEIGEESAVKILANLEEQKLAPETRTLKGVGRTIVETAVGAAPGGVVAAAAPRQAEAAQPGEGEPGAPPGGPPVAPAEPTAPPGPPTGFREDVDRRIAALDERLAAAQEDVGLTEEQRGEVARGIEAERAAWQTAREQFENTAPIVEGRQEVERLTNEIADIEGRPLDEDTKAKQIAARVTRIEELNGLLALNEQTESELEAYAKARRQAIEDADTERGRGARGIDTARLEREANFAERLLLERALVETPVEVAFGGRARTAFELDKAGLPKYPPAVETDNKDTRSALDTIFDVMQSRIWIPRQNPKYTRAEKAWRIRQARAAAARVERAREIMDAPAEQLPGIRNQLVQAMIDTARAGGQFDQGRVTELAAVLAREADARGEKINYGQAKARAMQEIQRLLMEDVPPGPPPAGASPPAPAPGTDPGPGGAAVGYDVVNGWLVYTGVKISGAGRAVNKTERVDLIEALRKAFTIADGLVAGVAQSLNIRWLYNTETGSGTLGWYYPSRAPAWLHGMIATDLTTKDENDQIHTTTHETGHAIDDVRRSGRYLSEESGVLAQGTPLRAELEAADQRYMAGGKQKGTGLNFGYPLRFGVGNRENLKQIELFAQIIGYYHSNRQDLAKEAPLAHALAKEIVDGLNQLASAGRPGQQPVADVVSRALSNVGNAPGVAPGAPPGPGAGTPPAGPGVGGASPGVAAPVGQPGTGGQAPVLTPPAAPAAPAAAAAPATDAREARAREYDQLAADEADPDTKAMYEREAARIRSTPPEVLKGVDDGLSKLQAETTFLGPQAALAYQLDTVEEAIRAVEREIAAGRAQPARAAAPAAPGRVEAAPAAARPAAAAPAAPAARAGAVGAAPARAPGVAPAGRPAQARPEQDLSPTEKPSLLPGVPASDMGRVKAALARIFGLKETQLGRVLPGIELVLEADIKGGTVTLLDGSQLSEVDRTTFGGYHPESNRIILIADRMPRGWERAIIMHELFHKRGAQFLGGKQIQRMRDELMTWAREPKGSPERQIYDAAIKRARESVSMARQRAQKAGRTMSAQAMEVRFQEELLPYAIEEAVKLGLQVDPKQILAKGAKGWMARIAQIFRDEIARFLRHAPKSFSARDLMVAAYGAAQLELTASTVQEAVSVGRERVMRALRSREAFAQRRTEARRGEERYIPEELTPRERMGDLRPSELRPPTERAPGLPLTAPRDMTGAKLNPNARRRLNRVMSEINSAADVDETHIAELRAIAVDLDYQAERREMARGTRERTRGADIVRERLLAGRRRGDLDPDGVEMALWLIDQNPTLAEGLGISVRAPTGEQAGIGGWYNELADIITLFKGATGVQTATHEILHRTEKMMPDAVRTGVLKEWWRQLADAHQDAVKRGDEPIAQMLQATMLAHAAGNVNLLNALGEAYKVAPYEFYQFYSPSEFWAVNASRIMEGRFGDAGWIDSAKRWLTEFIQKVRGVLGLKSDAPILKALNEVLTGEFQERAGLLADEARPIAADGSNGIAYDRVAPGSPLRMLSIEPAASNFATPGQANALAGNAPPPGPTNPKFSIHEIFSPKTAAAIKSRDQLGSFADTLDMPTTPWFPQFRDRFITNWQDHQRPFLAWLRDNVLSLKPWQELKLIPGKLRDMIQQYERNMLDPLLAKVNAFGKKHGLDSSIAAEVVGQWTTMRHIPEANAALRTKLRERVGQGVRGAAEDLRLFDRAQAGAMTPEERANYGGMAGGLTDAEANAIREKLERRFSVAELTAIGDDIVAGFAKLKDDSLKSGQLSPDVVKKFPKFKHYVALTGTPWDDTQIADGFGSYVAPNLLKEREGRNSVADPALVALTDRMARVAAYASSRDFKRELNQLWTDAGGQNNTIGLKRFLANTVLRPEISDVVWQGDDGKRYVFRWAPEHRGVGESILSKNREYADNTALRLMDRATRLFSRAVTQWTFMFAPYNSLRDIQEKSALIRTRNVRDSEGNLLDVNKLWSNTWSEYLNGDNWKAAYQLAQEKRANAVTAAGQYANDLVTQGGVSTWGERLSRGREEIGKEVAKHTGFRSALKKMDEFVSNYNLMLEVMSSIAVHAAMRKMGVDPKEAAFQTLELMNFNNQGAKTAYVRAFYSFFNPALQSGTNLLRQLSTKRGFYDMLGLVALSLVLQMIARATGEDDEELGNELDQRGSFEAERNITFKFFDTFWKIPVGYGLPQFAHAIAVNGSRYATGRYDASSAVAQQMTAFVKTFSPIPPSEIEFTKQPANFFLKSVTPTVFRPVVDIATDTNAWGNKLTAFFPDRSKFQSEQGKPQTPVLYKDVAQGMREATGIDLYPEQWRAILEGIAWGPLGYGLKSVADSNADMEGRRKDPLDEVPGSTVLRLLGGARIVGGQTRYLDARYHQEYDKAAAALREQNAAKAKGNEAEWRRENPDKAAQVDALKNQERVMRGIAKEYNATIKRIQARDSDLRDEAEMELLARIQTKREEAMRAFLKQRKIAIEEEE